MVANRDLFLFLIEYAVGFAYKQKKHTQGKKHNDGCKQKGIEFVFPHIRQHAANQKRQTEPSPYTTSPDTTCFSPPTFFHCLPCAPYSHCKPMKTIRLNPLDAAWIVTESRATPNHVGGLLQFKLPENAGQNFMRDMMAEFRGHRQFTAPA